MTDEKRIGCDVRHHWVQKPQSTLINAIAQQSKWAANAHVAHRVSNISIGAHGLSTNGSTRSSLRLQLIRSSFENTAIMTMPPALAER
jgi:hypothetical protein